jgi:hypothetical protein
MIPNQHVLIGLDWSDSKHDFHLLGADGHTQTGVFKQSPEAIEQQIQSWRSDHPGAMFAVAIEASKGALINALLHYEDVTINPVNPAALAYLRKSHRHGGGKSDPIDAKRLAEFLRDKET